MLGRFNSVVVWIASLTAGAGLSAALPDESASDVTFLSVGQGDCTVIRHRGATILVDAGPRTERFDAGARLVAPKLRKMGIDRIDLLFLTHPDADHIGGLPGISRLIEVKCVATPAHFRGDPELLAALSEAEVEDSSVIWLTGRARVMVDTMSLSTSVPNMEPGADGNEGSLFVKASCGGGSVVLTGDADIETELRQLGVDNWSCDVLKAGHHGSGGSTGEPWLMETQPEAVIVSCGRENSYGHPAAEVLNRISRCGAAVSRTDIEGDIRFTFGLRGMLRLRP